MAYIVMAYAAMTYIVIAYVVMVHIGRYGLYCYGLLRLDRTGPCKRGMCTDMRIGRVHTCVLRLACAWAPGWALQPPMS